MDWAEGGGELLGSLRGALGHPHRDLGSWDDPLEFYPAGVQGQALYPMSVSQCVRAAVHPRMGQGSSLERKLVPKGAGCWLRTRTGGSPFLRAVWVVCTASAAALFSLQKGFAAQELGRHRGFYPSRWYSRQPEPHTGPSCP